MSSVCVSVIIPCYNSAQWIDKAVGSIKGQDFTDYELIIIDDASDDPLTKEKIAAYQKDPTIRVLVNEQNKGVPATRNVAMRTARGKYIANLDADDYYDLTFLGKAVSVMEKKDKVGIVYSYTQLFGDRDFKYRNGASTLIKELSVNRIHASCMFRKECFDQCGGYDEKMRPEDWDLAIRVLALGWKAYCIKEFLFFYQVRGDSALTYIYKQGDLYASLLYKKYRALYAKYFWRVVWRTTLTFLNAPHTLWSDHHKKFMLIKLACKERFPGWVYVSLYVSIRWLIFGLLLPAYGRFLRVRRFLKRMLSSPSPSKSSA